MLRPKSAYHDGTTHIVMSPLEFMQRLPARVLRPLLHPICIKSCLAPHAKVHVQIVPTSPQNDTGPSTEHSDEHTSAQHCAARLSWARLLKCTFDIDLEHCPNCDGDLRTIAANR